MPAIYWYRSLENCLELLETLTVSSPPEPSEQPRSAPLPAPESHFSRAGVISVLALITLVLVLFTGLSVSYFPELVQPTPSVTTTSIRVSPTETPTLARPLQIPPDNMSATALPMPANQYGLYEQKDNIYMTPLAGGSPVLLHTPSYLYSRAVPPIVTPDGQLLYSGDGLWLTKLFQDTPRKIATLAPDQVITSMVLNQDSTMVAWSTEPKNGSGTVNIYAGPLNASQLVYQHSASNCPCFRVFSFLNNNQASKQHTTLLLTDDRGDHRAVQYGLWTLDIANLPLSSATSSPVATVMPTTTATATASSVQTQLLDVNAFQMPLALAPDGSTLLYSTYGGVVPEPTNGSVPEDIAALNYANSLSLATVDDQALTLQAQQVLLPEQHGLSGIADYHWEMSPLFSPDGHTLVYVVFSSDNQPPFNRHSALYAVQITGHGTQMHAAQPQLLATGSSRFIEPGAWVNNQTFTFYADTVIYMLDIKSGTITQVAQVHSYAHIVATVQRQM